MVPFKTNRKKKIKASLLDSAKESWTKLVKYQSLFGEKGDSADFSLQSYLESQHQSFRFLSAGIW